jgi:hypothetical protein
MRGRSARTLTSVTSTTGCCSTSASCGCTGAARPDGHDTAATDRQAQDIGRDTYIKQAIQEARERQEAWERGVGPERDNDRDMGHGIE